MLLLDHAALVVERNASILLGAWIIGHFHHAFLVLYHSRIGAAGTWVLILELLELMLLNRGECNFRVHVQEGPQLSINIHLSSCCNDVKGKAESLHCLYGLLS